MENRELKVENGQIKARGHHQRRQFRRLASPIPVSRFPPLQLQRQAIQPTIAP